MHALMTVLSDFQRRLAEVDMRHSMPASPLGMAPTGLHQRVQTFYMDNKWPELQVKPGQCCYYFGPLSFMSK